MKVTATELRQNLYRILDTVLETGEPVEVARKGGTVRIVPDKKTTIWDRLEAHDVITGDIEDSWDGIWDGEPELDTPGRSLT
ncbi:MAG: type II toxin-antitoxin system prevent-host-death family antitoxin [Spirochaetes bacterium]|nr:type II toxin-antitoxin system prevent-host-death family antitoxin [Spirochaetota bacterium]